MTDLPVYEPSGAKDCWNPAQYERFKTERAQPFWDLLSLIRRKPAMRVLDLGCGTGELTRELHQHLAAQQTLGIDNSPAMLKQCQAYRAENLTFELQDLADLSPGAKWDLIFANASLQWAPEHERLLARLVRRLAPGGQLAVQVPANHDHPSHTLAHALAAESPYVEALGGYVRGVPVLLPEAYAELIHGLGFSSQLVRLQVYGHALPGAEEVVSWVKGTLLTDYERRMAADLFARFLASYQERLVAELGISRPYFYPFKRILLWAELPLAIAPDDTGPRSRKS